MKLLVKREYLKKKKKSICKIFSEFKICRSFQHFSEGPGTIYRGDVSNVVNEERQQCSILFCCRDGGVQMIDHMFPTLCTLPNPTHGQLLVCVSQLID